MEIMGILRRYEGSIKGDIKGDIIPYKGILRVILTGILRGYERIIKGEIKGDMKEDIKGILTGY